MNTEELSRLGYTLAEVTTPDPLPVQISYEKCGTHGFRFVSYPRDANDKDDLGFVAKCPLRVCFQGIRKPRKD